MKLKRYIISLLLIVIGVPLFATPLDFNRYFIEAARIAQMSVVNIIIYNREKNNDGEILKRAAYASGTIISADGVIVTNYHVVQKGNYFQVVNCDGMVFELEKFTGGDYILADPKTDLAIIRVSNPEGMKLNPARFSDSNELSQGEWVLAIGNPYGLKQSITGGIVSSTGRDNIGFTDIEDFIQTDVPINPGNSGGPLVDLNGNLVGINTAISTVSGGFQGISFAIPSNIVREVCRELLNYGRVRRGWLGFLAEESRAGKDQLVVVKSVIRDSPADMAGLISGDIIREIDGKRIRTLCALIKNVGNRSVGTRINITVSRDGKLHDIKLLLRERNEYTKIRAVLRDLFNKYGIEIDENSEKDDIIVSFVSPSIIWIDLKRGDSIISLNGKKVFSLDNFISIYNRSGQRINTLEINRDSRMFILELKDKDR
jgi:serine protease Do